MSSSRLRPGLCESATQYEGALECALIGGLVGGVLWHLDKLSVLSVSRVVPNSLIYGSLGLIPVFMIGLYLVWWILLFGAQVAYAFPKKPAHPRAVETHTFTE